MPTFAAGKNNAYKHMKIRTIIAIVALLPQLTAVAQEADTTDVWDLQTCIDYAISNNIQIQQSRLALEESDEELAAARAAMYPTLSFSTSHNITNRPFGDSSNQVVDDGTGGSVTSSSDSKTTYNGSYGLNASWTVWNGGKRSANIKQSKLSSEIAELDIAEQTNTLEESIAELYIQILYTADAIIVSDSALSLSIAERDRAKERQRVGSIAKSDVAQLESEVADAQYQLINSQASLSQYQLQLKQTLELDASTTLNLKIISPTDEQIVVALPSIEEVYQRALAQRPEIQSSQLSIESSELSIKSARAGYYPTINLSAGTGTSNTSGSDESIGTQWKNNWNNTVGLSISVPILDNRQNKSSVSKAKIQQTTSELNLINEQKTLRNTIETLWLNAQTAQQRYLAAVTKVESCQESYDLVFQQFDVGLKNTVDMLTEKNNLLSAQQEMLQAKYTAILNIQLLKFYQGEPMTL